MRIVFFRIIDNLLNYSLPCQGLRLPLVASDSCGFSVATCRAPLVTDMIRSSAAASAFYVNNFALAFAHRWSAFAHYTSPYLGGGDIRTTLSPRTIIKPSLRWFSTLVVSSVSSRTRFRCWSKPFNLPRRLFPPFSRTSTILLRFCSRISVVISLILNPRMRYSSCTVKLNAFKPI